MRAIAGEECDAAARSRRDRLSGDVGGRPGRADRGLRRAGSSEERADELTRAAAAGRGRGAVRPADDRREAGLAVADRADRDRAAVGHAAAARAGSTGSTGTAKRSRFRVVDYKTGKKLRGEVRRAAGRADAAAAAVRARGREAARDRPGRRRRRVRLPDPQGRVPDVDWTPEELAARHADVLALLDAIVDLRAARGLHHRAVATGACDYCPFNGDLPRRPRRLRRAQGRPTSGSPGSRPRSGASHERRLSDQAARERIAGELGAEPRRRGRRRHRQDDRARRAGHERARDRQGDRRRARRDHVHREGGRRALDPRARRARATRAATATGEERERVLGGGARPVPLPHRDDPQLRDRAAARAPGRGRDRPAVRGASTGSPAASSFDAAYEAFQDELLVHAQPRRSTGRCGAGSGSTSSARRASCSTSTATCARSRSPATTTASSPTHLAEFRRIADELRALLDRAATPATTGRVDIVEGIIDWTDELEALDDRGRAGVPAALPRPAPTRT